MQRLITAWFRSSAGGPTLMEIFLAVTALRWAVYIMLPIGWLENARSGTITQMAEWLPAVIWAAVFLALAGLQCYGAVLSHRRVRVLAAFLGMVWWFVVAVLDTYVQGFSSAAINIMMFSIAEWAVFFVLLAFYAPIAPKDCHE